MLENGDPFEHGPALAERAGGLGLRTAAFVSSYVLHPSFGFARGFDEFTYTGEEPDRPDDEEGWYARGEVTTDAALAWLGRQGETPFFAWVHYFDPHLPYEPPKPLYVFTRDEIDLTGKKIPTEVHGVDDWSTLVELNRRYRGEVRYVDVQVGRLVEGLRERGLLERVAIVFTADHGEGLGDHGLLGHGRNLHEELLHVPLIVRAPGLEPGRRVGGPAQLEDVHATLLSLMGGDPADGSDGRDLLPWLRGLEPASPREAAFGRRRRYEGEPVLYYEHRGRQKWIGSLDGSGTRYDLAADPREREGVPEPAVPDALGARVAAAPAPGPRQAIGDTERRALEALGYARPEEP
ncbi:MAG: sulfatase [Myxococcota bacterium]|nr:sulfatase [Myxococcota bacterium]